ncbi:carbohydrate deacetylase [Paenibacillus macerans]|uniref:carbohydrate deacetylase n=1 Tax=Paenibacillus macerans TaxID=44252 RepID=UPI00203A691C|nr:ChbG/HpnK family deacetylase [Paenibacillus macerans]MCM3701554.1 ChbG/HpnK family deacetylase [Paenibacillus macerans]
MLRSVIINADDFGLSPAVNCGIIEAYQAGGVTSTSLMVNMPGFGDALSRAEAAPGLGIGLHFNLTYGRPVSSPKDVPSLVGENGGFHGVNYPGGRDSRDVKTELAAQWRRFTESGLRPTHLDSHHLLHQTDPAIYKVMAEKACRENVPLRRSQIDHRLPGLPSPRMIDAILLDSYGEQDGKVRLIKYLCSLRPGFTEIACHPGHVDETLRRISNWTDIRERELSVFIDLKIPEILRHLNILPVNYHALPSKSSN